VTVPARRHWRHVFAFHRPKTLQRWFADDVTIRRRLRAMPPHITQSLRGCQIDAVRALEASLAADKHRALIQMAAGAGKTFTACTLSHRLLEHGNSIAFCSWPTARTWCGKPGTTSSPTIRLA
jgi:type I site-specific restriction endonuclease